MNTKKTLEYQKCGLGMERLIEEIAELLILLGTSDVKECVELFILENEIDITFSDILGTALNKLRERKV